MTDRGDRGALGAIAGSAIGTTTASRSQNGGPNGGDLADERALVEAIGRERLTGLALAAVERGDLHLSTAGHDELWIRHEDQLMLDLRLERLLVEAATLLERADIPYRALKGPVLAHTVYADPSLRSFGDIDLLVADDTFDRAIAALRALDFERRFIEPRRGFDARFSKGACLERADDLELDLHRTLAPGAFGLRLGNTELFRRSPRCFDLAGKTITGIDPELAFVHACFHAALGDFPPRLVPLRDVVELHAAGFDTSVVTDVITSVRCESVLQRAVHLVEAELGIHLDGELVDWLRAYRSTRFDRWALRGYDREDRSYATQVAASLCALPSVRDRAAYVAALAFPRRDYVRARERSYARRLNRGVQVFNGSRTR
ncbi:MAG TPA: nucleotidyltransferase family protein [Acidimicrobiia bacterium]|jgi:hypothetical protein|nr:nucleotidyltransferase family protein [Acidimicrobiia bacterium]